MTSRPPFPPVGGIPAAIAVSNLSSWMVRSRTKEHLIAMVQQANLNLLDERRARRLAVLLNWTLGIVTVCAVAFGIYGWWLALGGKP